MTRTAKLVAVVLLAACSTTTSNMRDLETPAQLPGYAIGYDSVFSAALGAVRGLRWKLSAEQRTSGLIAAWTWMNLLTHGDSITIRVFPPDASRGDTLTRVGFTSWTPGQLIDWGRGNDNQRRFYERLVGLLGEPARPASVQ